MAIQRTTVVGAPKLEHMLLRHQNQYLTSRNVKSNILPNRTFCLDKLDIHLPGVYCLSLPCSFLLNN